jgi:amphi-Trp domain-containing protein
VRVTDQSQPADAEEAAGTETDEDEEFELEGMMDHADGARVLRRLASGIENGTVELGRDEGPVSVPDQFEIEVEYEEEDGEEAELEVELEWPLPDEDASSEGDDEEKEGGAAAEESESGDEEVDN